LDGELEVVVLAIMLVVVMAIVDAGMEAESVDVEAAEMLAGVS